MKGLVVAAMMGLVLLSGSSVASGEERVVFYSAMDTKTLNGVVQQFDATHPGITVQALRLDGQCDTCAHRARADCRQVRR